MEKSDIGENP